MNNIVTFDRNGYHIDGKPVWIASGEFQYFRMTRADWAPRLLQLKLAGFNAVSVYFPWNYHEVAEGVWDFSGDKDAEAFLKTAAETGLYVVARPGPFICNEWEGGGIPAWLSAREGIRLRTADPQYLAACDKWWDKIAPLIAQYQLGREGTIILAQIENEYGHMGEHQEPDYIYHLRDGLRARGVTVPLINCDSFIQFDAIRPRKWEGVNLCCNAGGDGLRVLQRARKLQESAPLFVTEFWIAAFDWWGRDGSAVYGDDRAVNGALEMVAGGAGGLTVFVFSGGSNFGYWHGKSICSDDNFIATLYGPGAPILDDGQFSGKYNRFKKAFTGLMSLSGLLAGADMPTLEGEMDGLIKATRKNGDTSFTFYVNHSKEQMRIADAQKTQAAVDMSIPAGTVRWEVEHLPLTGGVTLESATASLFAADPALVFYGPAGQPQEIRLSGPDISAAGSSPEATSTADGKQSSGGSGQLLLTGTPREDGKPVCWQVETREGRLTVALLSDEAADRWFRVELPGMAPCLLGGVDRIQSITRGEGGAMEVTAFGAERSPCWKLDGLGLSPWQPRWLEPSCSRTLPLSGWKVCREFPEAAPDFDDSGWYAAAQPQPMAKFGRGNGRAWYRSTLEVETEGWQMLTMSGACDRWMVFVDGQFKVHRGVHTHFGRDVALWLTPGRHTLAILAENLGMYNTGAEMAIPLGEPKGIFGPCWLNGREIVGWRMREGTRQGESYEDWPEVASLPWGELNPEEAAGRPVKGPCWLTASFEMEGRELGSARLKLTGAGKGSVWVNGFNIGRYWKVGPQDDIWIPSEKLQAHNQVVLLEEESLTPERIGVAFTSYGLPCKGTL